jgi:hypothetical protein
LNWETKRDAYTVLPALGKWRQEDSKLRTPGIHNEILSQKPKRINRTKLNCEKV